jgi:hypothetical protein
MARPQEYELRSVLGDPNSFFSDSDQQFFCRIRILVLIFWHFDPRKKFSTWKTYRYGTFFFFSFKCLAWDFSPFFFYLFYNSVWIRIQIRTLFFYSDPAKIFGFFRIHNTGGHKSVNIRLKQYGTVPVVRFMSALAKGHSLIQWFLRHRVHCQLAGGRDPSIWYIIL